MRNMNKMAIIFVAILIMITFIYSVYSDKNQPENVVHLESSDRILVIAPHPDDEVLAAGGLINKAVKENIPVYVVVMTCGDAEGKLGKKNIINPVRLGYLRHQETINAAKKLGLPENHVIFLGFPDCGLAAMFDKYWDPGNPYKGANGYDHVPYSFAYKKGEEYCGENVVNNLEEIISVTKPTIIIYPDPGDYHTDHWATYLFVQYTLTKMKYTCTKYTYLVHKIKGWPSPPYYSPQMTLEPPKLLRRHVRWVYFNLTEEEEQAKAKALSQYKSQITPDPTLEAFVRRNELFGIYPEPKLEISKNITVPSILASKANQEKKVNISDISQGDIVALSILHQGNKIKLGVSTNYNIGENCIVIFHVRIFSDKNVSRIDIICRGNNAFCKKFASNSISVQNISMNRNKNSVMIEIPTSSFDNAYAAMFGVDIIKPGKKFKERSDYVTVWLK